MQTYSYLFNDQNNCNGIYIYKDGYLYCDRGSGYYNTGQYFIDYYCPWYINYGYMDDLDTCKAAYYDYLECNPDGF